MSDFAPRVIRTLITSSIVLTCVLFLPSLADPVNVVKLTVLVLAALAILFVLVLQTARDRVLVLPRGLAAWSGLALLAGLVLSAAVAPNTTTAVIGTYGRNSGLLAYAAALIVFFAGLRVWSRGSGHVLAIGLLAAGLFTASYGLLQFAGIDAVRWNNPFSPIIAALGNPDFASAYLGICTPVAAWGLMWQRWALHCRIASAVVGVMCLVAAVLSHAVQGPIAAAAGLAVFVAAVLLERGGRTARAGLLSLAGVAALGVVALAAGAAKLGPLTPIFRRTSFQARQYYWDAALTLFERRPLTGVGLDHYGVYWRQVRPDAATRFLGGQSYSDSAHSVPLQMLAQGGLVLGVTYLLFLVVVGGWLVRGLLRQRGPDRLLLAGIGGAWVAYVVSSAVSIDQVPLLTLEFATAGAVVALAGGRVQEIRLPGALAATPANGRRGRKAQVVRARALTPGDLGIIATAGVAALVAAWFAMLPARADAAVRTGDHALALGQGNPALTAYQRANRLLPGVGIYWEKTGFLYESVKQPALALDTYRRGSRHDPFDVALLTNGARLAASQQRLGEAAAWYRRAMDLDPTNPHVVAAAAGFETAQGRPQSALTYLARPLALLPDNAVLWASAGAARATSGDRAGARRAFNRALALEPSNAAAKNGLSALQAGT